MVENKLAEMNLGTKGCTKYSIPIKKLLLPFGSSWVLLEYLELPEVSRYLKMATNNTTQKSKYSILIFLFWNIKYVKTLNGAK